MRDSPRAWITFAQTTFVVLTAPLLGVESFCGGVGMIRSRSRVQVVPAGLHLDASAAAAWREKCLRGEALYFIPIHSHEETSTHHSQAELALRTRTPRRE